jgi:serine/threonine-protein kinase
MCAALLTPGTELCERYKIVSALGSGGMAAVYAVVDASNGTRVALKMLLPDQVKSEIGRARFFREFEILQTVHHPNVVSVFEFNDGVDGTPFFTMEEVRGKSIRALLSERKGQDHLPLAQALQILQQIASALEELHTQGILYCDLKPSNVMLLEGSETVSKLIDFGIAQTPSKNRDSLPIGNALVGTSYYMSPEQVRGDLLDVRSDIYSFGVLAFELLAGRVPFAEEGLFGVTASHLIGKIPDLHTFNAEAPRVLDRLVKICMSKDREDRYRSMGEVKGKLERIERGLSGSRGLGGLFRVFGF